MPARDQRRKGAEVGLDRGFFRLDDPRTALGPGRRVFPFVGHTLLRLLERLEGVVLKDRDAPYRSGSRQGWSKLKAPDWHERHRRRFGPRGGRPVAHLG